MKNLEAENPCSTGILARGGGARSTESTATSEPVRLDHEKSKRGRRKMFVIASFRRMRGNPVNPHRTLMSC